MLMFEQQKNKKTTELMSDSELPQDKRTKKA